MERAVANKAEEMDKEPEDFEPVFGHTNTIVYCDETGMNGTPYYGFGSLWIPLDRRAELAKLIQELRDQHNYRYEIKWQKVSKQSVNFYLDLVQEFFQRDWLSFHCLVVRVGYSDKSLHKNFGEETSKRFGMLIKKKIQYFCAGLPDKSYHVRVDPLPSGYSKADEAAHKIVTASLKKEIGLDPIKSIITRQSHQTPGIQLADVLLGATLADWLTDSTADHKRLVRESIAQHLGWPDLRADTMPDDWKFNIWYFFDPSRDKKREVRSRQVNLRYQMPEDPRRKELLF